MHKGQFPNEKALVVAVAVVITLFALSQSSVLPVKAGSDKFRKVDKRIPNQYVVLFKTSVRGKDVDRLARKFAEDNNGRILYTYKWTKGFAVEMTEKDAIKLSEHKDVEFVEENGLVSITQSSCPNSSAQSPNYHGVDRIDQRYQPRDGNYCPTRTGRGVNIFVLDTGIWPTHDDFKNANGTTRAAIYYDATSSPSIPYGTDCNGHGTKVASVAGGNLYGVAKEANIYGVKVFPGCSGQDAPVSVVAAGVDAVSGSSLPQKVINMSLAASGLNSDMVDAAVLRAINSYGIPVIAGAGNGSTNASTVSPARVQEAITVAASDMSSINYDVANVTEYRRFDSNYGSLVDLFAPGSSFVGAAQTGHNNGGSNSEYDGLAGTSAAAPHVAGIAAMYLEAHPNAPPSEVQQAIVANATSGVLLLDPNEGSPNRVAYTNFLSPPTATVQFSSANYAVTEGTPSVTLTLTRTGSTANVASVKFFTDYNPGVQCTDTSGQATQRCDFTSAFGTIRFLPGEASKTFTVLITDDGFVEPTQTTTIQLSMPSGVDLGSQFHTLVTIMDNDSSPSNPIDATPFFIRQHYADFLNREPEPPGLAAWISILDGCPPSGVNANGFCDRIEVSSAFYRSTEFQVQGSVVYRYYSATIGRIPGYTEFFTDMARISGFQTEAEREANKVKLFEDYAQRPEFAATYNSLNSTGYVDQLAVMSEVAISNRDQLINDLNTGQKNRAQVLRDVVEFNSAWQVHYFNEAFVIMEYFGYLRRDADISYLDWINTLNSTGSYRVMINGFMNSAEYRQRFGQ